jgi:hypothetical protein
MVKKEIEPLEFEVFNPDSRIGKMAYKIQELISVVNEMRRGK